MLVNIKTGIFIVHRLIDSKYKIIKYYYLEKELSPQMLKFNA